MNSPRLPNIVYTADRRLAGGAWATTARLTDAHPDGSIVTEPDAAWPVLWRTLESERGLLRIEFADFVTPEAPDAWFVHVDEPTASPPGSHLVAFVGDALPAGTVVSRYQFASLGVRNELQSAAVRWYPRDGLVHQVYVAEGWRRQQLGTRVLYAAEAFHRSMGWPGTLHGDGKRTDLGQMLVGTLLHPQRVAPHSELMPPMDPSAG